MTQEQFQEAVMAKLNAIAKAVAPREGTVGWVGSDTPPAVVSPTPAEIIANPAKYDGTQWDPIKRDFRISSTAVIANFETMSKAGEFPGGTLQEWARVDFPAVWRFINSQFPGIDVNRLSASQRAFLGL